MEFLGTKGTYEIIELDFADYKNICVANENIVICHINLHKIVIDEEVKANALLISKAPEMLEMLKELVTQIETFTKGNIGEIEYFESEIKKAKQLIKEATTI